MAFKMRSPLHNGDNKSKTPQVDKFMKMNERVSKTPTVTEKANMVMKGISSLTSPPIISKHVEKYFQNDQSEEADKKERAEARTQLPAPGSMVSPLHYGKDDKNSGYGGNLQKADITGSVVDLSGAKTTEKDDIVVNSNTGEEETIDGNNTPYADKLIEKGEGEQEGSGNELYDYNPAMYARRKARKDKRDIRRKQRESRIVGRQYGYEEGRKVDKAYTGPRSMDEATYENPDMRKKRLEQERKDKEMQEKMDQAEQNIDALTNDGSSNAMTPNRAGRPVNSNMLMTSPQLMHGKHSVRDAVAQLRMRKIAQSE